MDSSQLHYLISSLLDHQHCRSTSFTSSSSSRTAPVVVDFTADVDFLLDRAEEAFYDGFLSSTEQQQAQQVQNSSSSSSSSSSVDYEKHPENFQTANFISNQQTKIYGELLDLLMTRMNLLSNRRNRGIRRADRQRRSRSSRVPSRVSDGEGDDRKSASVSIQQPRMNFSMSPAKVREHQSTMTMTRAAKKQNSSVSRTSSSSSSSSSQQQSDEGERHQHRQHQRHQNQNLQQQKHQRTLHRMMRAASTSLQPRSETSVISSTSSKDDNDHDHDNDNDNSTSNATKKRNRVSTFQSQTQKHNAVIKRQALWLVQELEKVMNHLTVSVRSASPDQHREKKSASDAKKLSFFDNNFYSFVNSSSSSADQRFSSPSRFVLSSILNGQVALSLIETLLILLVSTTSSLYDDTNNNHQDTSLSVVAPLLHHDDDDDNFHRQSIDPEYGSTRIVSNTNNRLQTEKKLRHENWRKIYNFAEASFNKRKLSSSPSSTTTKNKNNNNNNNNIYRAHSSFQFTSILESLAGCVEASSPLFIVTTTHTAAISVEDDDFAQDILLIKRACELFRSVLDVLKKLFPRIVAAVDAATTRSASAHRDPVNFYYSEHRRREAASSASLSAPSSASATMRSSGLNISSSATRNPLSSSESILNGSDDHHLHHHYNYGTASSVAGRCDTRHASQMRSASVNTSRTNMTTSTINTRSSVAAVGEGKRLITKKEGGKQRESLKQQIRSSPSSTSLSFWRSIEHSIREFLLVENARNRGVDGSTRGSRSIDAIAVMLQTISKNEPPRETTMNNNNNNNRDGAHNQPSRKQKHFPFDTLLDPPESVRASYVSPFVVDTPAMKQQPVASVFNNFGFNFTKQLLPFLTNGTLLCHICNIAITKHNSWELISSRHHVRHHHYYQFPLLKNPYDNPRTILHCKSNIESVLHFLSHELKLASSKFGVDMLSDSSLYFSFSDLNKLLALNSSSCRSSRSSARATSSSFSSCAGLLDEDEVDDDRDDDLTETSDEDDDDDGDENRLFATHRQALLLLVSCLRLWIACIDGNASSGDESSPTKQFTILISGSSSSSTPQQLEMRMSHDWLNVLTSVFHHEEQISGATAANSNNKGRGRAAKSSIHETPVTSRFVNINSNNGSNNVKYHTSNNDSDDDDDEPQPRNPRQHVNYNNSHHRRHQQQHQNHSSIVTSSNSSAKRDRLGGGHPPLAPSASVSTRHRSVVLLSPSSPNDEDDEHEVEEEQNISTMSSTEKEKESRTNGHNWHHFFHHSSLRNAATISAIVSRKL